MRRDGRGAGRDGPSVSRCSPWPTRRRRRGPYPFADSPEERLCSWPRSSTRSADGVPYLSPRRTRLVAPDLRARIVGYLATAPEAAPGFRTDGAWVWPEAWPPRPGAGRATAAAAVRAHARASWFLLPDAVSEQDLAEAARVAAGPPTPRPARPLWMTGSSWASVRASATSAAALAPPRPSGRHLRVSGHHGRLDPVEPAGDKRTRPTWIPGSTGRSVSPRPPRSTRSGGNRSAQAAWSGPGDRVGERGRGWAGSSTARARPAAMVLAPPPAHSRAGAPSAAGRVSVARPAWTSGSPG